MSILIIENNAGTIKAYASHPDMNFEDIIVEAEVEQGDPGEKMKFGVHGLQSWGQPSSPATCEITRVYIEVGPDYDQNLDKTILYKEVSCWEDEIIKALESGEY